MSNHPTSFESVRSAVIAFMRSCEPHMGKLRDRQLLKEEINRISGTNMGLGSGMKHTGVTRPLDSLGRIVVPSELRNMLGWKKNTSVEFTFDEEAGTVYISKYAMERCAICGDDKSLTAVKGKHICEDCISIVFEGDVTHG